MQIDLILDNQKVKKHRLRTHTLPECKEFLQLKVLWPSHACPYLLLLSPEMKNHKLLNVCQTVEREQLAMFLNCRLNRNLFYQNLLIISHLQQEMVDQESTLPFPRTKFSVEVSGSGINRITIPTYIYRPHTTDGEGNVFSLSVHGGWGKGYYPSLVPGPFQGIP